jgi:hypothetical protein
MSWDRMSLCDPGSFQRGSGDGRGDIEGKKDKRLWERWPEEFPDLTLVDRAHEGAWLAL